MDKNICVDVLMPTFNGELFIAEQIESILNQSHSNFRLLIRDDNSSDSTLEIIKKYQNIDKRIVIINEDFKRIGLVKSIEELIAKSNAEYLLFSDQDDYWFVDKVKYLLKTIIEYENVHGKNHLLLIHSDAYLTNSSLKIKKLYFKNKPLKYGIHNSLFRYYVQGASMIINRAVINHTLPFPESVYIHDRYFHLKCELLGNRYYLNIPLMLYRQHNNNVVEKKLRFKIKYNIISGLYKNYYQKKDRELISYLSTIHKNIYLHVYNKITSDNFTRAIKIGLIRRYKISLRLKDIIVLIIFNK